MAAYNDITGDAIKSKPNSKQYLDNYDKAFGRKTAYEWAELDGIKIHDPDGWRVDNKSMNDKITYKEYVTRVNLSTVLGTIKPENEQRKN